MLFLMIGFENRKRAMSRIMAKDKLIIKEKTMVNRNFWLGILVMVLVFGMAVVGCDDGSTGGNNSGNGNSSGNGGTLTVNNCPSIATVVVCDSNTPTTLMELSQVVSVTVIAAGQGSRSPFALKNIDGSNFTRTGSFLVVLTANSDNYFKGNVNFSNGSATVDFNSMTSQTSLPVY